MEEVKGDEAQNQEACTREELTELVRAIKFAKPDISMRACHREIAHDLSQKEGFEFLKDVKLNDVKRVWKKAMTPASQQEQQPASVPLPAGGEVMKLYTVGDGTVRTLAKEYSQAAAAAVAAEAVAKEENDRQAMSKNFVHVFLDVPADRSGSRPHQALLNFHENDSTKSDSPHAKGGDCGEVVKIQVAASPDDTPYPMLMYNADRSLKTFIHPDPQHDGYQRIRDWIVKDGSGGALGSAGGTKAYFFGRTTKRKNGANVISIDVSRLAPPQSW
jgi:hypothetical protein